MDRNRGYAKIVYALVHLIHRSTTMLEKIGMREFRNNLAKYLNSNQPIAVIRHGQTVGYFFPTHQPPAEAELAGLKRAAEKLDAILQEAGITEDTLVTEFRQLREQK
jgi:hypothetical protein